MDEKVNEFWHKFYMDHGSTKEYGFVGKSLILSFSSAGGTCLGLIALRFGNC